MAAALMSMCCGRKKQIIDKNGQRVSSYADLNSIELPKERRRPRQQWKAGWYPVEILTEPDSDGYVTVHYTGWSHTYDTELRAEELQPTLYKGLNSMNDAHDGVQKLKVVIKENLNTSGKFDSKVVIRVNFNSELFNLLEKCLHIFKITPTKTIYSMSTRDQLSQILENDWDFRLLNLEGDCCYVKTNTLRVYRRERKELKTFVVSQEGNITEKLIPRGDQIVVSFVKCSGNSRMIQHLLNDPVL